jgi:hypothetical protein
MLSELLDRLAGASKPPPRVNLEDLKGGNIAKSVFQDCLQEAWSIFPWALGAGVGILGIVAHALAFVGLGIGLLFVGTATFIWNYIVHGERRAIEKVNYLRQRRRDQDVEDLAAVAKKCRLNGFNEGASKANDLKVNYGKLVAYLVERSGGSVDAWRVLADDTFKQGYGTLVRALDVHNSIESVNVEQIQTELTILKAEFSALDPASSRARNKKASIDDHQSRLDLVETNKEQLAELLQNIDGIATSLQEALLKIAALSDRGPEDFLDADGGAANRLRENLDAAKRVEQRLRGLSDDQSAQLRNEYMEAGK